MRPLTPRGGRLYIVAAALLWSSGGLAIKLVPLPALGVAFWRSLLTAIFLIFVLRPAPERWRRASWATALVYAAMILSFISATKMTTAANAIFLQYTAPLYVLLFAPILLKEPFRRADAVTLGFALLGMTLFFVGKLEAGALAGNVVGVFSGLFFGGVILFLRRDTSRDAMASVLLGNLLAALFALPFARGRLALDAKGVLLVLFLGVVQMGLSYILYVKGLSVVPAAEASLLSMIEPVLNPVWVWLGIGERPTAWAALGGAVVLLSVAGRTVWGAVRRK
ncbi:MAG: DMT family transporter [Acidithiobacillales bacterium]